MCTSNLGLQCGSDREKSKSINQSLDHNVDRWGTELPDAVIRIRRARISNLGSQCGSVLVDRIVSVRPLGSRGITKSTNQTLDRYLITTWMGSFEFHKISWIERNQRVQIKAWTTART